MGKLFKMIPGSGTHDCEAHDVLRNARSMVDVFKADGDDPNVIVIIGSEKKLPCIVRSEMTAGDLALAATLLQFDSTTSLSDRYEDDD